MIDFDSGAVRFDDGLVISSSMTLAQAKRISTGKTPYAAEGRNQVGMGTHRCQDQEWGIGVAFMGNRIHQAWMQCLTADGADPHAWEIENERIRKRFHDNFLEGLIRDVTAQVSLASVTYNYDWGSISSTIDMRGVQSLILIEYGIGRGLPPDE